MTHIDALRNLAQEQNEVSEEEARSVLSNAEEEFESLKRQLKERFPLSSFDGPDRKGRSEFSRAERAEFYQEMKKQGKDPNEEWKKLPE